MGKGGGEGLGMELEVGGLRGGWVRRWDNFGGGWVRV